MTQVKFDASSKRLLTCSEDKTAQVWDVTTGEPVGMAMQHAAAVNDGDFSPDGRWIITGCSDGTANLERGRRQTVW